MLMLVTLVILSLPACYIQKTAIELSEFIKHISLPENANYD